MCLGRESQLTWRSGVCLYLQVTISHHTLLSLLESCLSWLMKRLGFPPITVSYLLCSSKNLSSRFVSFYLNKEPAVAALSPLGVLVTCLVVRMACTILTSFALSAWFAGFLRVSVSHFLSITWDMFAALSCSLMGKLLCNYTSGKYLHHLLFKIVLKCFKTNHYCKYTVKVSLLDFACLWGKKMNTPLMSGSWLTGRH